MRPWDFRQGLRAPASTPKQATPGLDDLFGTEWPAARSASPAAAETGASDKRRTPAAGKTYWITKSSGKVHNQGCRYYGKSNGYPTKNPVGPNCGVCGGASRP